MTIDEMISDDEGLRLKPYLDCCGKYWRLCVCQKKGNLTIGNGRNLDTVGISEAEADILRQNDIAIARAEASRYPWYATLNPARRDAIAQMMFNLGAERFANFKRMFDALSKKDFNAASSEMLGSVWASEVGKRAVRLARIMKTGVMAQ